MIRLTLEAKQILSAIKARADSTAPKQCHANVSHDGTITFVCLGCSKGSGYQAWKRAVLAYVQTAFPGRVFVALKWGQHRIATVYEQCSEQCSLIHSHFNPIGYKSAIRLVMTAEESESLLTAAVANETVES